MMRPNHEFLCSVALSPGFRNWVEMTCNMQQEGVCVWGGGGCHIKEEGLHGSRGGRPAEGACAKKDV